MGTLTSVAFAAATNIRFRSFHCNLREKIKTPMPKVTSPLRERYRFSSPEETRGFKAVVKCLGNDQNDSRGIDGGENRDTKSSVIRDSTVETASREEEDADEKSNSSSINEFGSDKTPYVSSRVHSLVSDFTFPFCPDFNCKTVSCIPQISPSTESPIDPTYSSFQIDSFKLMELLGPERVDPADVKLIKDTIFGYSTFWVTKEEPFGDLGEGILFLGNLRGKREDVFAKLQRKLAELTGDKYNLFMIEEPNSEGPDPRGGARVSFGLLRKEVSEPGPTTLWQYVIAFILFLLTIGSSVELGIASQINRLPPEVVRYFTDPNAVEPPDMELLYPFVDSALPLAYGVLGILLFHHSKLPKQLAVHLLRGQGLQPPDHLSFDLLLHRLVPIDASGRVSIVACLRVVLIDEDVVSIDVARFSLRIMGSGEFSAAGSYGCETNSHGYPGESSRAMAVGNQKMQTALEMR
ncbi:hypothetical protein F2Q70_00043563 [Brassica cretica]|uniref:Uncharacterized protein n=1 Tax=Brassica cretica TaxID=69181 RepID=A0A8S9KMK9_BRACR|nr:hypothetical protein F2Q70_00043563 [Brassica cretica]